MSNGKRMISIDFKSKEGIEIMRKLCASADVILDTFRPGVLEKLGLGPDVLMKDNSRLIYARLTGYGQNGYYKSKGGHDLNYVAMSGVLSLLAKKDQPPVAPLNLLADFAGGSLSCALGIVLALFERTNSGKGQIVDASMTEGCSYFATWLFKSRMLPFWSGEPGTNALDGGLPCYGVYKTKDNKYVAVAALEPQFYTELLKGLQLSEDEYSQTENIQETRLKFQEIFMTKTQEEWTKIFEDFDACFTPVLELEAIDKYKHYENSGSFYRDHNNLVVPEPAPKLSRTPGLSSGHKVQPEPGQDTREILQELGYSKADIEEYISKEIVHAQTSSKL